MALSATARLAASLAIIAQHHQSNTNMTEAEVAEIREHLASAQAEESHIQAMQDQLEELAKENVELKGRVENLETQLADFLDIEAEEVQQASGEAAPKADPEAPAGEQQDPPADTTKTGDETGTDKPEEESEEEPEESEEDETKA